MVTPSRKFALKQATAAATDSELEGAGCQLIPNEIDTTLYTTLANMIHPQSQQLASVAQPI